MNYHKILIFFSIALMCLVTSTIAKENTTIVPTQIDNVQATDIRIRPSLSSADTCIVRHDQGIALRIGNWVQGNELYKGYLDPSLTCDYAYPYAVTEINMPMWFYEATTITLSVDVEQVDNSDPNCTFPDTIMLGISSTWSYEIPGNGLYNIWVPFDEPVIVDGPFFAGFFIGDISNPSCSASIVTDENILNCVSYNVWDDSIGFVDLMDWGFPGQLVLYASGIPGGGPSEPAPAISILTPQNNDTLYQNVEIWTNETSNSPILEYVSFEYSTDSTNFIEINRDYDGTKAFRDGINPSNVASGYSLDWDFSALPEGNYIVRATSVDTLGRTSSVDISVYLEPTPPIAEITSPSFGSIFCPNFDLIMASSDENLNSVTLSYHRSNPTFSINAQTLLLSDFGNYYSSAISASLALQALHDRGQYFIMTENSVPVNPTEMTEIMANYFSLAIDNGVYDESIYQGLKEFIATKGSFLHVNHIRYPDYLELRTKIELEGHTAIVGLGGSSGNWVLIDGFAGTKALDGTYQITISNPLTATVDTVQLRLVANGSEIFYNGSWQSIDIAILISTDGWSQQLTTFGFDINRNDGWSYNWTPPNLWQDYDYFILSKGSDATGLIGYHSTMFTYDCTQFYVAGDYNNDGVANIDDLNIIIAYFTNQGSPPVGGDSRADANCDGYLNITDIIYFANYLFGSASTPCY